MKLPDYFAKILTHPDPAEIHCGTTPLKRGLIHPPSKRVRGMIRRGIVFKLPQSPHSPISRNFGTRQEALIGSCARTTALTPARSRIGVRDDCTFIENKGTIASFLTAFIAILLLGLPSSVSAQDYTQTINRTAQFADTDNISNELVVYNISGSVTVEGYDGNEIRITAEQELEGSDREIEQARKELELVVEEEGNRVLIYLDAPFIQIRKRDGRISYHIDRWDDDYEFLHDVTVRVPRAAHVRVSTINRGRVSVSHTQGRVHASNVNGGLELTGIRGETHATTVNGDITIRYERSPDADSEYQTVNGTIDVRYPDDLSADIRFRSMHGELYTDFSNIEHLPARVERDEKDSRGRVTYRVDRYSPIRIGDGGPLFSFQVLNGDVYVRRVES